MPKKHISPANVNIDGIHTGKSGCTGNVQDPIKIIRGASKNHDFIFSFCIESIAEQERHEPNKWIWISGRFFAACL
jgi:hypothetical protein